MQSLKTMYLSCKGFRTFHHEHATSMQFIAGPCNEKPESHLSDREIVRAQIRTAHDDSVVEDVCFDMRDSNDLIYPRRQDPV